MVKNLGELRSIVKGSFNIKVFEPRDERRYGDLYTEFLNRLHLH
jgi:hypothetical protein